MTHASLAIFLGHGGGLPLLPHGQGTRLTLAMKCAVMWNAPVNVVQGSVTPPSPILV